MLPEGCPAVCLDFKMSVGFYLRFYAVGGWWIKLYTIADPFCSPNDQQIAHSRSIASENRLLLPYYMYVVSLSHSHPTILFYHILFKTHVNRAEVQRQQIMCAVQALAVKPLNSQPTFTDRIYLS